MNKWKNKRLIKINYPKSKKEKVKNKSKIKN